MNSHYQYVSPLKYLHPYHAKDHESFFGRKKEVKDVFRLFKETNLVVIYGPSGSGKTSLVQCGLTNQFFDWKPITIRRSENLIDSFFKKLKKIFDGDLCDELKSSFEELYAFKIKIENDGYAEDSNDILKKKKANLTLIADKIYDRVLYTPFFIFDQFEELFIFGDFNEIEKFSYLLSLLSRNFSRGNIVICIQTEFFANLLSLEGHNRHIIDYKYLVDDPDISQVKVIIDKTFANFNINQYKSPITEQLIKIEKEVKEKRRDKIIGLLLKIANERDYTGKEKIHLPFLQIYLNKLYIEDFYRTYSSKSIEYEKQLKTNNKEIGKIKKAIKNGSSEFKELKEAKKKINHKILDVYKVGPDQVELPFKYLPLEFEENEIELFGDISKIIKNYLSEVNQIVIERDNEIKKGKHNDVVVKFLKHFITEQNTSKVVEIEYRERISDNIEQIDEYLVIKDEKLKEDLEFDLFPNVDEINDVDESIGDIIEELLDARILKKRGNFIELSQSLLIPIIKKIPVKKMIKEYYRMHFNSAFILYSKEKIKKPLSLDRIKEYKKYLKDIIQNDSDGKKKAFWDISVKHHEDIKLEEERKIKEREEEEKRKERELEEEKRASKEKINRLINWGKVLGLIFVIIFTINLSLNKFIESDRANFSMKIVSAIEKSDLNVTKSFLELEDIKNEINDHWQFEKEYFPGFKKSLDWKKFPAGENHLSKLKTNSIAQPFYLNKINLPRIIGADSIKNRHILSTKSRYDSVSNTLHIFAQSQDFLHVAKVKFPLTNKDESTWNNIVTNLNKEDRSVSSYVPFKENDSWKLIYSNKSGVYETKEPYIESNLLTDTIAAKELKVIHRLEIGKYVGLGKNNKKIYEITADSNDLNYKIHTIPNVKTYISSIHQKKSSLKNNSKVSDYLERNRSDQNNAKEEVTINKITSLRKYGNHHITYIVCLGDDSVYFIKQRLGNPNYFEEDFKAIELKINFPDLEINCDGIKSIEINDDYITFVTSSGLYQRKFNDVKSLSLNDKDTQKVLSDNINSIDLEDNLLLIGSNDASAKIYTSFGGNDNRFYQLSSTLKGHKDAILNVSFKQIKINNSSRLFILTSGEDGSINIWDAATVSDESIHLTNNFLAIKNDYPPKEFKKYRITSKNRDSINFKDVSIFGFKDGFRDFDILEKKKSAIIEDGALIIFTPSDSVRPVTIIKGQFNSVDFISDSLLVVTKNGHINFHGRQIGRKDYIFNAHTDIVNDAQVSEDGILLISCSNDNTSIIWEKIIQPSEGKKIDFKAIDTINHVSNVNKAIISEKFEENNYLVATSSDNIVKLHKIDVSKEKREVTEILSLIRHDHKIVSMSFGIEEGFNIIYTADEKGFVKKWNWKTFEDNIHKKTYGVKEVVEK